MPPQIPSIDFNFQDTGKLVYISRTGERFEERPQLDSWSGLERKKAISLEEKKSFQDWSGYLEMMYDDFAPSIEDHMPVYYVVKLWNLLNK